MNEASQRPVRGGTRCEYHAQDIALEMDELKVPVLITEPGLETLIQEPGVTYMKAFTLASWEGPRPENPRVRFVTLADSRACLWFDQPDKLGSVVDEFLKGAP